jgi:hypothetical protein
MASIATPPEYEPTLQPKWDDDLLATLDDGNRYEPIFGGICVEPA